jgi:hypothetical protein
MAGEDKHDRGEQGVQRVKRWLERTTRVDQTWTRADSPLSELLHFQWPCGDQQPFSYDLGGRFQGGDLEGQSFIAEVKNYTKENDLAAHYVSFLAKCYVALGHRPERCDHFLWVAWSPFQAQHWDEHVSEAKVLKAVLKHRRQVFGEEVEAGALAKVDHRRLIEVADRLWLITLAQKQERLVIADEHYRDVRLAIAERREAS